LLYAVGAVLGVISLGLGIFIAGVSLERNLFESSYATRLNRNMGLYFGLRS
jgi:hypothetical protein